MPEFPVKFQQITWYPELRGKTIAAATESSDQVALRFTDGSIVLLTALPEDLSTDGEPEIFWKNTPTIDHLYALGMVTNEQYTAFLAAKGLRGVEARVRGLRGTPP